VNIKGKSRAGDRELANHLLNAEKNETVNILSSNGTVAGACTGAFHEMEAIASATRCKKPLYHAKTSPDPKEPARTLERRNRSIEPLRKQLGLRDHAYSAVLNRNCGKGRPEILRAHVHVGFCASSPSPVHSMHGGHNCRKHELVARRAVRPSLALALNRSPDRKPGSRGGRRDGPSLRHFCRFDQGGCRRRNHPANFVQG
jgi:hypothetical protein